MLPERPPASSGSAGECRTAATCAGAGRGGAWAAGGHRGRPWSAAGGTGRARTGERAVRDVQLWLLPLPVMDKSNEK